MREMKNSGIEWIGDIPSDWTLKRNKVVFSCSKDIVGNNSANTQLLSLTTRGVKLKSQDTLGGKTPESFDTYQYVNKDDIIMCLFDLDCSAVFSGISPYDGMISPAYKILKCRESVYPQYADYWFSFVFIDRKFKSYAKNLRYTLNYDEFADLLMLCPSYAEQKKIDDYLDEKCAEIDTVIEKTKATIEEYKKLKQSVITQAVTKGIRPNRPMKDSGIEWIGEIAENWSVGKIKYGVTKVGSGKTPYGGAESYPDEGVLFLRSQNIYDTGLVLDSPTFITAETDDEMKNTRVRPNDVLLNITGGSIGRCCVFPEHLLKANVNQHVSIIRVNNNVFMPQYIHYYWLSRLGKMSINLFQTGGNREGMSADAIKNSPIAMIPLDEQKEIVDYLDKKCSEIDELIAKKTSLLSELESYKKSLIYEYVTGKKEV